MHLVIFIYKKQPLNDFFRINTADKFTNKTAKNAC